VINHQHGGEEKKSAIGLSGEQKEDKHKEGYEHNTERIISHKKHFMPQ
jgi:hypothetical protein